MPEIGQILEFATIKRLFIQQPWIHLIRKGRDTYPGHQQIQDMIGQRPVIVETPFLFDSGEIGKREERIRQLVCRRRVFENSRTVCRTVSR